MPVSDWSWRDGRSRAESLKDARRVRVARRAQRLLAEYQQMQQEATAMTLMHTARLSRGHKGMASVMAGLDGWLYGNTVGTTGLDLPGTHAAVPGAFMRALAESKGGLVTGRTWGTLVLPERHQDVMRREQRARGQVKRPCLTGDVKDAPESVQMGTIRRLVKER